ncbi:MAG: DNA repair protein RadC [Cyclobacteriaceae bacterium]|nr:DNA repair protein RadC [Cyclobacteriaceae bacterium HetDA_MAG_MS6]
MASNEKLTLTIKEWAEEDRPREKLIIKGKSSLSEAELLGILIGSGTKTLSAVDVGKLILQASKNDLNALARLSVNDLKKFKGIGEAKAVNIVSALELGRRRKDQERVEKIKINCASDTHELMTAELLDQPHEEFWVILLRRNNELIKKMQVSKGGVSGTVADPKIIFKSALESLASGVILVHNHPSGNLKPSTSDIRLTQKIKQAGQVLDIKVIDHVIFANDGFYSFADQGML